MSEGNGWSQWQKHVLSEVQRLNKVYDELHVFAHNQQDRITQLTAEFGACRQNIQDLSIKIATLIDKREEEIKEHVRLVKERQQADRRARGRVAAMFVIALLSTATSIAVALIK